MDNMETKNEKKRGLEGKHYVEKKGSSRRRKNKYKNVKSKF